MLKQHLKLFLRNVQKNKVTFLINTVGLGIGIASFLVLALYVYNDVTYNHFNTNLANIYRIQEIYQDGDGTATKGLVLPKMMEEIPEVVNGTRVFNWDGHRLSHGNVAFPEQVFYADKGFFSVFTFPFVEGDAKNILDNKFSVVISKPIAEKYFGTASAIGKELQVGFSENYLVVKGVVDIPENSSVKFDVIASYETGETLSPWIVEVHDWYNTFSESYVVLQDGIDPDVISDKLERIVKENFLPVGESTTKLSLLPFADYHAKIESNQTLIIILAFIALGVLGIAIVNFINLTVTNSLSRTKEIGIKKVHGATKKHIVRQIMVESLVVGLISLAFGLLLMSGLLLPSFNNLFETNLSIGSYDPIFLGTLVLGIWAIVGLFSGLVPSFLWSRSKLVENLHGKVTAQHKPGFSKYASIVVQFVIAIMLISGTLIVRKQIDFMIEKDPKFDAENTIVLQTDYWQYPDTEAASQKLKVLAQELEASPLVSSVSFTGSVPGDYDENYNTFYVEGKSSQTTIYLRKSYVGENYFKTMGIPVKNGQGFEKDGLLLENTIVLNKTAMDKLGFDTAQEQILREGSENGQAYRVIGTIDDFTYQGVQNNMQPLAHFYAQQENYTDWDYLAIRAQKGASLQAIELLKAKWQSLLPDATLTHFYADEKLNAYYKEYERVNTLITWFSLLAVLLSCIGLLALASFAMAKRTKEIGIRKVNGAKVSQILNLLNKDFLKWVLTAFIIAVPFTYYGAQKWLEGFAYRTEISWWVFALAGVITLVIALLTVSWQSLKAAKANPVKSLRTE
ncbi:FtsX-like permease family protein [Arenibacter sp. GZD96]|uniref:ABC transporter permease n=1 Tax=Aurantibrevibacter litoralis TaxID=3106030 RepID=UPI002AFED5BF|nr:ABC transporter permease [Arenibacter sp. GZD-96]MEA1786512.1 FtsX-like permease family protein [Arenibacter sp. GZD-96]